MFKTEFDYTTLTYANREAIHGALAETTVKHIDRNGELFAAMPFDPAASPSQLLETTHLHPVPSQREEIDAMATFAGPNLYPAIKDYLHHQESFTSAARLLMAQGTNIFPVSTHGNIADIALWSAAWSEHIAQDNWQEHNGLIISRGVTTIEAFNMAASEVIEKIGHVFMSFPRTKTIRELGFDDKLVDTNNRNMRKEVKMWLEDDLVHRIGRRAIGKSLNQAWSGKTDVVQYGDNGKPEKVTLGKVSDGTLDLIKHGLVLPMAMWDGDEPFIRLGELTTVKTREDIDRVQNWQSHVLAHALGISQSNVAIEQ